jgi:hypothetical protein
MSTQNIYCWILILIPLFWIAQSILVSKSVMVKFFRSQLTKLDQTKRNIRLTNWKVYGFINLKQYQMFREEFGLSTPDPKQEELSVDLTKEQISQAEGLAVLYAAGGYRKRVTKLAKVFTLLLKLQNEVNANRRLTGSERLELDL